MSEVDQKRPRSLGPRLVTAAVTLLFIAFAAGLWWDQQDDRRQAITQLRQFLEYDGDWTFYIAEFEPHRVNGIDLTPVADSISVRSFEFEEGIGVGISSYQAILVFRADSEWPRAVFVRDSIYFTDDRGTRILKLHDSVPYERLIELSPWTAAELEPIIPADSWERVFGE